MRVETARTRRGETVVVLTDEQVAETALDGLVQTADGTSVVWYRLGRPFVRDGVSVRYGYLTFDRNVSAERQRRRDQRDWAASSPVRGYGSLGEPLPKQSKGDAS